LTMLYPCASIVEAVKCHFARSLQYVVALGIGAGKR